jgi:small subunit ribosomal protein S9
VSAAQAYYYGTGRRKTAIARVRVMPGSGTILINGKMMEQVFPRLLHQSQILRPLRTTDTFGRVNLSIKVVGGGQSGQAGAISHGIARALVRQDEGHKDPLRKNGLLTRDARAKERKKYGLKRARKAPQYTKR